MPTNYTRQTNRKSWNTEQMDQAMKAVKNGMPVKTAAANFVVPRTTLIRHLANPEVSFRLGPLSTVFSYEQEKDLVQHLLDLEKRFYGITMADVKKLAYDLAEKNQLQHPFNKNTKTAGKAWLSKFLKRNPEISFRMPEATSAARARGFNKASVSLFFDLLEGALLNPKFSADRIYNADETGVCTVPPKKRKIAALKGKKQVGSITSAERGETTTAVMCMSAAGQHLPPFLIFARTRMHDALKKGAPCGSKFTCNPSGYMTADIFGDWFDHFLEHVRPCEAKPALLIVDGHSSHTKNLSFTEKAKANFVTVLVLPPHCSHKMQPLDVSFMAPFKSYYASEVERFLLRNPGKVVSQYDIAELINPAFIKAATMSVAVNGFCKTGIWPCNRSIFDEDKFAPSAVTDQPAACVEGSLQSEHQDAPGPSNGFFYDKAVQVTEEDITFSEPDNSSSSSVPLFNVSPSAILPLPKMVTPSRASKEIKSIKKERKQRSSKKPKQKQSKVDITSDSLCEKCGSQFSDSDSGIGWKICLQCISWFHTGCLTSAAAVCQNCF